LAASFVVLNFYVCLDISGEIEISRFKNEKHVLKMAIFQQQPKKGLIESANCEGSVPNAKTLYSTICEVSLCMIPSLNKYHTLKYVWATFPFVVPQFLAFCIPQIIVFICALQFITFCVHTLSKQSNRYWGLLWRLSYWI